MENIAPNINCTSETIYESIIDSFAQDFNRYLLNIMSTKLAPKEMYDESYEIWQNIFVDKNNL
jgi:hypothetical protein